MMEGAQEVKADPEGFVEGQLKQDVPEAAEALTNPSPDDYNPFVNGEEAEGEATTDWWDEYSNEDEYGEASRLSASTRRADSSVAPETLPGPRVMHIGPGESPEPFGYSTDQGEVPSDDPSGEGFVQFDRILEDGFNGGVTGDDGSTDGDSTMFKTSAEAVVRSGGTYSWLPGADNQKMMNYYDPGLTEFEIEWMRAHSNPDHPIGSNRPGYRSTMDPLWESRMEG